MILLIVARSKPGIRQDFRDPRLDILENEIFRSWRYSVIEHFEAPYRVSRPAHEAKISMQSETPIKVTEGIPEKNHSRKALAAQVGARVELEIERAPDAVIGCLQHAAIRNAPVSVVFRLTNIKAALQVREVLDRVGKDRQKASLRARSPRPSSSSRRKPQILVPSDLGTIREARNARNDLLYDGQLAI